MADDRGLASSPTPLGGAAIRQAQRREHSLFSGPPNPPDKTQGLWTQFSGMPNQPGSPTSLHEWLQSVDDAVLSSDVGPGSRVFPAASSSAASSRNSPLDTFTAADFLSSGIGQDRMMNAPSPPNMGQHFDFSSPSGFQPSPDFGSPADFASLHSSQFHYPRSHRSSLPADMSGLPPADFTQPPPDFSFRAQPDFSRPPPSFLSDLPPLSPAADPHQSLPDFLVPHSPAGYAPNSPRDATVCGDGQLGSSLPDFDAANLSGSSMSGLHGTLPGNVDVTLPPPSFPGFSAIADDIIFQDPIDMETPSQNSTTSSFERVTPSQRKIQRQNSEPVYGGAAADEGKAMYVEALRRLNSFGPSGPSYEPFGSAVPPPEDPTEPVHTFIDEPPTNVCKQAKAKEPPRKEPSKPSYSDVAKASKGKSSHAHIDTMGNEKTEPEMLLKASTEPAHPKPHRHQTTRRLFTHTRVINQRAKPNHSEGSHSSYVQPNSRYGLDQFEDLWLVGAEQRSSSVESLNSQLHQGARRRSSNSSLSSSTSAVEDSHVNRLSSSSTGAGVDTVGSRYNISGKDIPQDRLYNNNTNVSTPGITGQASHKSSANPSHPTAQTLKNEKLFFDPKRIFQSGSSSRTQANLSEKTKMTEDKEHSERESTTKEETVLNNGKPNNTSCKASAASHRKTDYINNDLREGSSTAAGSSSGGGGKRTNQTAAFNRHGSRKNSSKDSLPQNGSGADRSRGGDTRGRRQEHEDEDDNSFIRNIDWVLVDEWMKYISDCSMTFARNSFSAVLTLFVYILGIIMYLAMGAIHLIAMGISKLWMMVKSRIFKDQSSGSWSGFAAGAENARKRFGLEENITLPATGEEAMKRLLACKGKDPYSILGLRADASDEDIKRYYRRQAVLVHPDKNQEPGAEEAFKILGHAFEMIGETTKRKEYDAHIFEASEAEAAMREFSDLLTKLQEKVQEAANMMRCDHCGGKHRRIPVDRAWYSARYCDRCNIHHSAKEGDVWAESSMLGFLWHYYACMDNNIYDITEWVSCQRDNFKHMKANAHPVFYRIQTDSNRRHRQGQSGEADLEDFINRLFNKASMSPDGASHPGWQFPSQQSGASSSQSSWGASSSSTSSSKRSRRKKKRN